MLLVTPQQMRDIDRATIEDIGIPGIVLMERAALGCVDILLEQRPNPKRVGILCGPGNNGGDGFAIARMLSHRGVEVVTATLADPARLSGDAATNWKILDRLGLELHDLSRLHGQLLYEALDSLPECDVWCDALLGTGIDRDVQGPYATAITFLNRQTYIIGIDVPSGLDALTGQFFGQSVYCDLCVTFGHPKLGQVIYPGREACGELVVVDIGIPEQVTLDVGTEGALINYEWVSRRLYPRSPMSHKGTAGKLLLIAGSPNMSGAAMLCARGAIRGGAGLVTLGTYSEVTNKISLAVPEVMSAPILDDDFDDALLRELQNHLDAASIIAMGPGLGQDEALVEMLRHVLLDPRQQLVLDADALNLIAKHELHEALRRGSLQRTIILTPHPGEMARLAGTTIAEIQEDPVGQARALAQLTQCVVVLKTASTVIAAPDGRLAINASGNPGMASAGMGDVLTGLIASRLPEHDDAFEACCVSVWIHGAAGDLCRDKDGERATTASGVLDHVGKVFARLEGRA